MIPLHPRIAAVQVPAHFIVELTFTDGSHGRVDLTSFGKVSVDREAGTIVWPNGVDLDPDMLFDAAQRTSAKA